MKKNKEACKNCEKLFKDSFKFCPYCGQQAKDELTVKVLFYNTISNYFSFDARFFKSFFPLLLRPGYLAAKFIEGKRLLYLHPAQMYLFIAVVFFFLFSFIQREQVRTVDAQLDKALGQEKREVNDSVVKSTLQKEINKDSLELIELGNILKTYDLPQDISEKELDSLLNKENLNSNGLFNFDYNKSIDSLIAIGAPNKVIYEHFGMSANAGFLERRFYAQSLKLYKTRGGGSVLQAFYDAIPIAMFVLLPIFALILKLLYYKHGLYAHHLVFSFYYFSFLFTVFSIILGINFLFDIPDSLDFLIMLSTFIYLLLALKRFYMQGWFRSFIKASVASFLFLILVSPLAAIILGTIAFLFY
ncbi:DUF3667 domain-containing protein [Algibacter mikhailovii]|uniref:DUF3667 domain-containing protein n=1 Tax=Algibacter mikhailovii TaxID=425498 RepID=A0A918QVF3_9FLAO|nr:DUF3667 domain-containing protein [Algibacter mikhailovii]GGZ69008.1 hypothetical protein GCM10007028_02430 [Algibacter mikhailovii]